MWTPNRQNILSEAMPIQKEATLKNTTVRRGFLVSPKTDFTLDVLVRELTFIVAAKKSDLFGSSVSLLDKYSADTVPTHLLQAEDGLIRRLGAVLLAFVFHHKSDVFRVMADDRKQPFCLSQSFLFMSKYKSSMRVFHPEALPHVSNPLMFYLPKNQFPGGLPGFLDLDKLYSILITKEYLRIPDPAEMVIWLPFEDIGEYSAEQIARNAQSRSESPEESSEHRVHGNNWAIQERDLRIGSSKGEVASSKASPQRPRHKADVSQAERLPSVHHSDATDSSAGHRIKCFQFFKKGPKEPELKDALSIISEVRFSRQDSPNKKEFGYQRAVDHNIQGQSSRYRVKRSTVGVKSSSVGPIIHKAQHITQEVTGWVTNKDYSFYTAKTQLVLNSETTSLNERCTSTDRTFKRDSDTPSNTTRQELKIKSDILAALELKQMFSDITKTLAEEQRDSSRSQAQAHELTEVLETEHDSAEDSSASVTDESTNRGRHPIISTAASRVASSAKCGSSKVSFSKSPTKRTQSTQQTDSLDSNCRETETVSESFGGSQSKPSLCTPPQAPRRLPSTSIERIALRHKLNPLLRRTPVSLQDCDQIENMKTKPTQQGPKISVLKPENNPPTVNRKDLPQADEGLLPISRMRNGEHLRLIPESRHSRDESTDRGQLRTGHKDRSDSHESRKAFRISPARTATTLLAVPTQTQKLAEPARRIEQDQYPRSSNQQPAGVRPVLFVKKVKQSLVF